MRPRLLPSLVAGLLSVSLLGPVDAVADEGKTTGTAASERASEALEQAQAVFAERSSGAARGLRAVPAEGARPDATMVLNRLMRVRDDLSPAEQREADALFARPTDDGGDRFGNDTFEYEDGEETPVCGEVICIHYASGDDTDAPLPDDTDPANGIPDAVDRALETAEQVHSTYVDAGYARPEGDGARGEVGIDMVDIYLADTGNARLYGYCTADDNSGGPPYHRPAYCVIDEDFAEFPGRTPLENQQVTLAHEYFHAVQYAYDAFDDPWFLEATATWAEDELYDAVDDNRQYLPAGQLRRPGIPLDRFGAGNNHYGNWIFFRHLSERWPEETGTLPRIVLEMWRLAGARVGDRDQFSTQAVQTVLRQRSTSFQEAYGEFAAANRRPAASYDEGASYPASPLARRFALGEDQRTVSKEPRLDHLTHRSYRFTPDGTRRRDWRLRVDLDMPRAAAAPVARLLTYRTSGRVTDVPVQLSRDGAGRVQVRFSTRQVERVELVLVNASRRSRCWRDTFYACAGFPRDDNRRTVFTARAFRR